MSEADMSNLMNQINSMLQNNEIPDDIKNMINNFKNSSSSPKNEKDDKNSDTSGSSSPEIDINTILKMKQIIDSMNSNKDDPRANLLMSLKPYLKESRKHKVDQYVQFLKMEKMLEVLGPLGGEKKK